MPTAHPWRLAELTLKEVREFGVQTAVLPFGATEPHNLHLPYATDNIQVESICDSACAHAWQRGARAVVLPAIPFGADQNMMGFPLAINLDQCLLDQILESAAKSLERHGVMKLVVVNGHGGNDFKGGIRTLYGRSKIFCSLINWFQIIGDVHKATIENPGEHADELETSLIQALRPDLVDMPAADDGAPKPSRFEAGRKGWVWYPRPFDRLTTNSGCGNPFKATPEKGQRVLDTLTQRIGDYLVELCAAERDATFPFKG